MKLDITKNQLYIASLGDVWQGFLPHRKLPVCHPRISDALIFVLCGGCTYTFSDGTSFTTQKGDI